MLKIKKINAERAIGALVLTSFLVPIIFLIYRIITTPSTGVGAEMRVRPDYVLMLVQCILGVIALILPSALTKKFSIQIPSIMYLMFMIFLWCAIFLGEIGKFYYNVPHWDTVLHAFSGAMLGALGFSFVSLLNEHKKIDFSLSPMFVTIFAFCFALSLGVLWEIYEFTFDRILNLNMQKFMLADGTPLVGAAALEDTMKDLIVDAVGALTMSAIGYISIKYKKGWLEKVLLKFTVNDKEDATNLSE